MGVPSDEEVRVARRWPGNLVDRHCVHTDDCRQSTRRGVAQLAPNVRFMGVGWFAGSGPNVGARRVDGPIALPADAFTSSRSPAVVVLAGSLDRRSHGPPTATRANAWPSNAPSWIN